MKITTFYLFLFAITRSFNDSLAVTRFKQFKVEKIKQCPGDDQTHHMFMFLSNNGVSTDELKLGFNGYLEITKDVPGPMELVMEINKCDLQMKHCEKYEKFLIAGMCAKFKAKNTFYSDMLSKIVPPMLCPLKTGNYTFDNPEIDLNFVTRLPLDGWRWIVTFKLINGEKNKKIVTCLISDVSITMVVQRRPKSENLG